MRVRLGGTVVDNDSAAIYRRWGYNDVCCPQDVRDAAAKCPEGEELVFELNSGGGSVYQGFEMYSVIRAHRGRTVAEVMGLAGSAMSVVIAACDRVLMSPVGNVMVHRASTYAYGNSRVMKETRQMLDTIDESILAAYTEKSGGKRTREDFARMMRNETFMTAQEAIECGLADGILEVPGSAQPDKVVASVGVQAAAFGLPPVEDLLRREREREEPGMPHPSAASPMPPSPEGEGLPCGGGTKGQSSVIAAGDDSSFVKGAFAACGRDGSLPAGGTEKANSPGGGEHNRRSEEKMEIETKEQLAEQYPELTAQIAREAAEAAARTAAEAAAKGERERIAGIDALAMPGFEEIITKAKADPAQNAGTVARDMILAQKCSGGAYLAQVQQDAKASKVNEVPAASSEAGAAGDTEEETVEAAAKAAVEAWKKEGAKI